MGDLRLSGLIVRDGSIEMNGGYVCLLWIFCGKPRRGSVQYFFEYIIKDVVVVAVLIVFGTKIKGISRFLLNFTNPIPSIDEKKLSDQKLLPFGFITSSTRDQMPKRKVRQEIFVKFISGSL